MLKKQDLGNTTECDKTLIKFFQIRRKHHIFQAGGQQALLHTIYQPLLKKFYHALDVCLSRPKSMAMVSFFFFFQIML